MKNHQLKFMVHLFKDNRKIYSNQIIIIKKVFWNVAF